MSLGRPRDLELVSGGNVVRVLVCTLARFMAAVWVDGLMLHASVMFLGMARTTESDQVKFGIVASLASQ